MFKKFCHIENAYQQELIDRIHEQIPSTELYVCQEKVDGTNFSFIVSRNESNEIVIDCGTRSAQISENESFYTWKELKAKLSEKIENLFCILEKKYDCSEGVNIFGEFFGGIYPNTDIKNEGGILTRIFYSPTREFYGYDIYIPTEGGYISPVISEELFKEAGIFCAETLFKGTIDECLKYPCDGPSTIGPRLGYESIPGNIMEGVVIKPIIPYNFRNGERVIVKNKNDKFKEISNKVKKPKEPVEIPENVQDVLNLIECYITKNRLENVISHIGDVHMPNDFGKVMKELTADVLQEFCENTENAAKMKELEKSENKIVMSFVSKACSQLIKDVLMSVNV